MANVIAKCNRPTLVLAHNKTTGGPAVHRVPVVFPQQRGGVFVSYYDYYQPEAYIPQHGYLY
mgnify:CR=1 FL=1